MTERQIELIMQIVREQLDEYLAPKLVEDLEQNIRMGIFDNTELLEELGQMD